MRVHWPPPNSAVSQNIAGWNSARPDSASSTKLIATIQWLLRSFGVADDQAGSSCSFRVLLDASRLVAGGGFLVVGDLVRTDAV
jgi:hypothetical protein